MRVDLRLLLLVMVFLVAAGDRVEARSLHWRELAVQARLEIPQVLGLELAPVIGYEQADVEAAGLVAAARCDVPAIA